MIPIDTITNKDEYSSTTTEKINSKTIGIDELSTAGIIRLINEEDSTVAVAVQKELPKISKVIDIACASINNGGKLVYIGAGTSGRLGVLDASECPPTFGTDPHLIQGYIAGGDGALRTAVEGYEDSEKAGIDQIDECNLRRGDVLIGITASGSAPYVLGAVKRAKELGAVTVGLVNNDNSILSAQVDVCIAPVVGPEVIMGSTRMKAGTAEKMVLNMISTAVMIKLGKVYQNMMVDLHASNRKLKMRSLRMIEMVTGCDAAEAEDGLNKADGSVKLAIMIIMSKLDSEKAKKILDENGGFLKKALIATQK